MPSAALSSNSTAPAATRIVSALRGRVRVRDPRLREPGRLERLHRRLATLDGVRAIECNANTGSLVLLYDAARVSPARLEAAVDAATDAELAAPHPARSGAPRVRINRAAKRTMLASLAATLVLAAIGRKRWHALSGGLFVAALAVHLAVHRRHVLR